MLDYSRCASIIYWPRDAGHYYLWHYGRKPDPAVMIGQWWRIPAEVYPDKTVWGFRSGPEKIRTPEKLRPVPEWKPEGDVIQGSLLDTAPGDVV